MYQPAIRAFYLIVLVTGLTGFLSSPVASRESLPEDLPEIPGPPRSAERTLYDTLRGPVQAEQRGNLQKNNQAGQSSSQKASPAGTRAEDLPLLPVLPRESSSNPQPPVIHRVPVVKEPAPRHQEPAPPARQKREREHTDEVSARSNADNARQSKPESQESKKPDAQREQLKTKTNGNTVRRGGRPIAGKHDPDIEPTPMTPFRYYAPEFYRGIYVNNGVVRSEKRYAKLLKECKKYGINTIVADVQPRFPDADFIRAVREGGFYLVARVVVFEGGLDEPQIPTKHLNRVLDSAEQAARSGFMEIQLDYIRFADKARIGNLSLKKRYEIIAGILKMATDRLRPFGVRVGADIFGRIPFNRDDRIGQRMEVFANHLDTLYPMLYPSHFYGDPGYIKDPYKTILHGKKKSIARVGDKTRIIAYIQGFKMSVSKSGLSYHDYILKQIEASADSGGSGFVVWNARSSYGPFFKALADFDRKRGTAR